MYTAKNNIIVPFEQDSGTYALMNPLSGSFDIIDHDEYAMISSGTWKGHDNLARYLMDRGYAFHRQADEASLAARKWSEFKKEIAQTQVQLLLIPSYGCNLACQYCYQAGMEAKHSLIRPEVIDAFFAYAEAKFAGSVVKPFITLFGGEPLINSPAHRRAVSQIVDRCAQKGFELAVVTNGFDLVEYVDLLSRARIKEIQVTLDGTEQVHNQRRATASGQGTFRRIVEGIEAAVQKGIPINLRTVVDQENLADLVELAQFIDSKGWLNLPPGRFKTQIGRNYELFECYAKPQHLMSQAELWRAFAELSQKHPVLKKFHRPDFKGLRHLIDTGEMYMASFDTCPAAKTEWVFDLNGDIYGCTASCGRPEYRLGSFYPEVKLKDEAVGEWQARNVNNIEECRDCRYNVICGGGCGVVAANRTGRVLSPDCRPIQELLDIGVRYYHDEILALASEENAVEPSSLSDNACASPGCTTCAVSDDLPQEPYPGCLVCGAELIYRQSAERFKCAYCGQEKEDLVACVNGHYVCSDCHSSDILTRLEQLCLQTDATDPIEILNQIFAMPGLNMHGPEYHSIVPASLVAAYANSTGLDKESIVGEAIRRGRDIKGGACGLQGACGAAVGAGIAYSVVHQVNPLAREERGQAMKVTATALERLSQFGGPRCCKRDSVAATEVVAGFFAEFKDRALQKYVCSQYKNNTDCIKGECPYFPRKKGQKKEGEGIE